MIAPLSTAADTITNMLRAASLAANVVSVMDEGYATLVAPFIAVDAPRLTDIQFGLAQPRSTVTVTVRVAPANTTDAAGAVRLADSVIDALIVAGCKVATANPVVSSTGVPAAIPVIAITVEMGMKG